MEKQEQSKKRKGGLVIGIVAGIIILALIGVIIYLVVTRNAQQKKEEKPRNVVVTKENVEEVVDELKEQSEKASVVPGYYTVTMNPTWHFKTGKDISYDAVVENVSANTNDVFFDIVLESDESKVLYKSPVIPRGGILKDISLDEELGAGTYPAIVVYHLIDENQETLSTLRVTLNIIIEE